MNRISLSLVVTMIGILLLTGCSGANKPSEEQQQKRVKLHYRIALDALHKNQLPKAFEELMYAEKIDPNQPEVLDALAYAWRLRGNHQKAEAYYKRAIRAGAGSSSHTNYGSLLVEMGRFEEAKIHLQKALEDPRYHGQHIAYVLLGDAFLGLKEYEKAIDAYRNAGRLNPNQTLTRIKEARVFAASNRLNFAQALFESVLRQEPANRTALEGLLEILKTRNNYAAARTQLQNYISRPAVSDLDRAWATDELVKLRHP